MISCCWRWRKLICRAAFCAADTAAAGFHFGELVLKGECLYLQTKDFAFEVSDIIVYYRKNGIVLERRAAENLLAATEGWVSALYLYLRQYHNGQSPQTDEETAAAGTGRGL